MNENIDVMAPHGYAEFRSWIEFDGEKYVGMGSKATYDQNGKLVDFKIEPTGLIASFGRIASL
jgi:hypothetical protein